MTHNDTCNWDWWCAVCEGYMLLMWYVYSYYHKNDGIMW
jgi:hypothetical protein